MLEYKGVFQNLTKKNYETPFHGNKILAKFFLAHPFFN